MCEKECDICLSKPTLREIQTGNYSHAELTRQANQIFDINKQHKPKYTAMRQLIKQKKQRDDTNKNNMIAHIRYANLETNRSNEIYKITFWC